MLLLLAQALWSELFNYHFIQVYKTHVILDCGKSVPIVYALLTNKDKPLYKRMLTVLRNIVGENQPKSITCDFEAAFIAACRDIFDKAELNGCFFHFKQSMWRKVQECGLAAEYTSHDGRVRKLLKRPQVLAFISEEDVRVFELTFCDPTNIATTICF